jgi:hypothetical protein
MLASQQKTARATTNAFVMDALAYRPRFGITDLVSQRAFGRG